MHDYVRGKICTIVKNTAVLCDIVTVIVSEILGCT